MKYIFYTFVSLTADERCPNEEIDVRIQFLGCGIPEERMRRARKKTIEVAGIPNPVTRVSDMSGGRVDHKQTPSSQRVTIPKI